MNVFNYATFCEIYENLKKTIGTLDDADPSTIGGVIKSSDNSINKGLDYVHNRSAKEIAENIASYFPDTSINDLEKQVQNYIDIDAWFTNTSISDEDFNHIQEIVENAGELDKKAPYDKLVIDKK